MPVRDALSPDGTKTARIELPDNVPPENIKGIMVKARMDPALDGKPVAGPSPVETPPAPHEASRGENLQQSAHDGLAGLSETMK